MTATVFSISRSSDFILEGKVFDLMLFQRDLRGLFDASFDKEIERVLSISIETSINYLPDYLSVAISKSSKLMKLSLAECN